MESWNIKTSEFGETPKNVKQFFEDIKQVCKKHKLSISHEDGHGGFIIEKYDESNIEWLSNASLDIDEEAKASTTKSPLEGSLDIVISKEVLEKSKIKTLDEKIDELLMFALYGNANDLSEFMQNEQKRTVKGIKELINTNTPKTVYIIMSPSGEISLSFQGIGSCFSNLIDAEKDLIATNEWSKAYRHGIYIIVPLEVK